MNLTEPEKLEVWVDQTRGKTITYRILDIDPKVMTLTAIDIFGRKAAPKTISLHDITAMIQERTWERVETEPLWWLVWPTDQIFTRGSESERVRKLKDAERQRDRNLRVVSAVIRRCGKHVFDGAVRARCVARLAGLLRCHADSLEARVRRYWQGGMNQNALLPLTFLRGGPGEARITDRPISENVRLRRERRRAYYLAHSGSRALKRARSYRLKLPEDVTLLKDFAQIHVLKKGGMSWRRGYRELVALHFSKPTIDHRNNHRREPLPIGQYPSFGQFFRIGASGITPEEASKLRLGRRGYLLKSRPLGGVANFDAEAPGVQFEIDATLADVTLLDRTRTHSIGRPVLYLVVDTWSQAIVGFSATLENASYVTAVQALECAITDKRDLSVELGFAPISDEDWPMRHLCGRILGDNGELRSLRSNLLVQNLHIDLKNARPRRPDDKPFAEVAFHSTDCRSIRWIPGATRHKTYGDPPSSDSAALTLDDFTKLIFISCIQANVRVLDRFPQTAAMLKEYEVITPNRAWAWGLKNLRGEIGAPPPQLTKINLMLHITGKFRGEGLEVFGMMYDCPEGKLRQAKIEARRGKLTLVPVAYDPRRIGRIWIRPMGGAGEVIELRLNARWNAFADWSLDELEWRDRMMRPKKDAAIKTELSAYATYSPIAQKIVQDAQRAAATQRRTKQARTAADALAHEVRAAERDARRGEEAGTKASEQGTDPASASTQKSHERRSKKSFLKVLQGLGPQR